MKRMLAFLLLSVYLLSGTEAYQLLKLPVFVSHFIKHCREEPGTTLSGFIAEHYCGSNEIDDDWQQDMQLPFKTCECSPLTLLPPFAPVPFQLTMPEPMELPVVLNPGINHMVAEWQVIKIFQPPRTAA